MLSSHMKKKDADFTPPAMLMYPSPEIILFMKYYNGIIQSSLVVVVAPCVGVGFRVFGGLVCAAAVDIIAMMMVQVRRVLNVGYVHGGNSENDFGPLNPNLTFEHKFENGHLTVGRYKKALTIKGMCKSGKWKAISTEGKIVMESFKTLFKKVRPSEERYKTHPLPNHRNNPQPSFQPFSRFASLIAVRRDWAHLLFH